MISIGPVTSHVASGLLPYLSCALLLGIWPFTRRRDDEPDEQPAEPTAPQLSADDYIDWGIRLASLERYDRAEDKFRRAIEADPDNAAAYYNLGRALECQSNISAALESYDNASQLVPESAAILTNYGLALLDTRRTDAALEKLEQAASIAPDDPDVHYNLGVGRVRADDYPGAVASFQRAVELQPDEAEARFNLGLALYRGGFPEEAAAQMNEFLLLSGSTHPTQRRYAEALLATDH